MTSAENENVHPLSVKSCLGFDRDTMDSIDSWMTKLLTAKIHTMLPYLIYCAIHATKHVHLLIKQESKVGYMYYNSRSYAQTEIGINNLGRFATEAGN